MNATSISGANGCHGPVAPAFADPVLDAQVTFRAVLRAISYPGRIVPVCLGSVPPAPLVPAAAAIALTLFDLDTPVWLDAACARPDVHSFLTFHCGCPITADPRLARFAVIAAPERGVDWGAFDAGTDEAPEISATLIVQTGGLEGESGRRLAGPGIETESRLEVRGLPESFWAWRQRQEAAFPRGVDVVFVAPQAVAALPRTTRVGD
jgi:alpha-D-ribose 1-methylphosphonate 5-triphosphate synthase subunit PhnH